MALPSKGITVILCLIVTSSNNSVAKAQTHEGVNMKENQTNNNGTRNTYVKKMVFTAIMTAIAVVGSLLSFPVFGSKCAPVQHLVNVVCAVTVGPWWAFGQAFAASLIRNLLALGSPLAFPGSMCGALLAGLLYKYGKKLPWAYVGEVVGTGIIGGMLSFPIARLVMGNEAAALFTFVVPFLISTFGGTLIAILITVSMKKTGLLDRF